MATADQIAEARLLIAEETEENYTDDALDARIDALGGNLDRLAYEIWIEKAAAAANLTDVSEAGSTRAQAALQDKALKMAAIFAARLAAAVAATLPTSGVVVGRLTR